MSHSTPPPNQSNLPPDTPAQFEQQPQIPTDSMPTHPVGAHMATACKHALTAPVHPPRSTTSSWAVPDEATHATPLDLHQATEPTLATMALQRHPESNVLREPAGVVVPVGTVACGNSRPIGRRGCKHDRVHLTESAGRQGDSLVTVRRAFARRRRTLRDDRGGRRRGAAGMAKPRAAASGGILRHTTTPSQRPTCEPGRRHTASVARGLVPDRSDSYRARENTQRS